MQFPPARPPLDLRAEERGGQKDLLERRASEAELDGNRQKVGKVANLAPRRFTGTTMAPGTGNTTLAGKEIAGALRVPYNAAMPPVAANCFIVKT